MPHQRPAIISTHAHQHHTTISKIQHLQCTGVLDNIEDVIGDDFFGADNDIDGNRAGTEQLCVFQIGCGTNAGNFGWGMVQCPGNLTGNHIDFVTVGDRNQHIGIFNTGFA